MFKYNDQGGGTTVGVPAEGGSIHREQHGDSGFKERNEPGGVKRHGCNNKHRHGYTLWYLKKSVVSLVDQTT